MRFPFPLGGTGGFFSEPRVDKSQRAIDRAIGKGGLSSDWSKATNRQAIKGLARVHASVSLSTDRIGYEMFPIDALPEDLLPIWETRLRIDRREPDTIQDRQWNADRVAGDCGRRMPAREGEGAGRGSDMNYKLGPFVGGEGNVLYRYNTAASLAAIGADQRGIFQVAFEVPAQYIDSIGKVARLKRIMARYVPAHVGFAVANSGNGVRGFRCDDLLSLTDRDVLRV